jgi:hypothetical protein
MKRMREQDLKDRNVAQGRKVEDAARCHVMLDGKTEVAA